MMAALFYGIRAGHPPPVLWMNVVMGAGIVYIAAWGLIEFQYFFMPQVPPMSASSQES